MSYEEHQAMCPQMIRALAAIDEALGLPADGCNNLAQTLAAISELRAELAMLKQTSAELCDGCGWRFLVPGRGCLNCGPNAELTGPQGR